MGYRHIVKHRIRPTARVGRLFSWAALAALGGSAMAQTVPDQAVPETNLDIPQNLQIFGKLDPNVRKPTAIVNNVVITGTDVDQRVGLVAAANNAKLEPEERERLKLQVLRQLIDETLEIQEATSEKITVTPEEVGQSFDRVSKNFSRSPEQMRAFLRASGSSERSLYRQIEGELAWQRYLRRRIEPMTNISDEEVQGILTRLEQSKGIEEYSLREIYLSSSDADAQRVYTNANQIVGEIRKGQQPFEYFARSFSESPTRGSGGDLGWVRAAMLPAELAHTTQEMQVGQVAGPIPLPGGVSILYLADKRTIGTADPRDARLSLKQLTIRFPPGTTQAQATVRAGEFAKTISGIQGCGTVERVAATISAEVVDNDTVRIRDLPAPLQAIVLKMQVGQSTPPFGTPEEGIRALVLCGRDDPKAGNVPTADQIEGQLQQQRVNLRAQAKLRDLRRDAVIEYR